MGILLLRFHSFIIDTDLIHGSGSRNVFVMSV